MTAEMYVKYSCAVILGFVNTILIAEVKTVWLKTDRKGAYNHFLSYFITLGCTGENKIA